MGMRVSEGYVAATATECLEQERTKQVDDSTVDKHDKAEGEIVATADGGFHDIGGEGEPLHFLMGDNYVDDSGGGTSADTREKPFLKPCQQNVVEDDIIDESHGDGDEEHHKECRGVGSGLKHKLGEVAKIGGAEKFKNFCDKIHGEYLSI